ncbi:hypothetical protein [Legionella sp. MW5194]|uniref:hypothetical protein n=1 Tax=Legionella sp. MW5194 TaxID=2662448 RepID=UPI00193CC098|nr:hypothetical protein [Legionella sp. MW5194]
MKPNKSVLSAQAGNQDSRCDLIIQPMIKWLNEAVVLTWQMAMVKKTNLSCPRRRATRIVVAI